MNFCKDKIFLLLLSTLGVCEIFSQPQFFCDSVIHYPYSVKDSVHLLQAIQKSYKEFIGEGYLSTIYEIIKHDSLHTNVCFSTGSKVRLAHLHTRLISENDTLEYDQLSNPQTASQWISHLHFVLDSLANHSYPLSTIHLNLAQLRSDSLYGNAQIMTGPKMVNGKLVQRNYTAFHSKYLYYLSRWRRDLDFKLSSISELDKQLAQLPYVELMQNSKPVFLGKKTDLWLYLKKKNASRFEFLLGLNRVNTISVNNQYRLTGEAEMELWNSFKLGEKLYLKYENLNLNSPRFKTEINFPFIFILPIGMDYQFHLFRSAESFIHLKHQLQASIPIRPFATTGLMAVFQSSFLLNPSTELISPISWAPSLMDFNSKLFGVFYHYQKLDQIQNPRNGIILKTNIAIGVKKYILSNGIENIIDPTIPLKAIVDSLNQYSDQGLFSLNFSLFTSLSKRSILVNRYQQSSYFTQGNILKNEMFRVGGFRTLRGFNEEQFLADHYFIGTAEYRFLLDRSSYLFLFCDYGLLSNVYQIPKRWTTNIGLGTGIQFRTAVGNFNLAIANGKQNSLKWDVRNTRVHFGYISLF